MSENKKEDIDLFKVVATYQMNELPSLMRNFLIVSFWIIVAIAIFIGIDLGFHFIINFLDVPLDNYSLKFDSLVDYINDLSEKYFLGKFGLWGSIIFIFFIIIARYDVDWFEKNTLEIKIPIWGWRKTIIVSTIILLLGFGLKLVSGYVIFYFWSLLIFFPLSLTTDKTFRKVAKRVYPDLEDHEKLGI